MNPLPLHLQFELAKLKDNLNHNPEQAIDLALNYYEDYLTLAEEIKSLSATNQELITLCGELTNINRILHDRLKQASTSTNHSPRLPHFLKARKH